VYLHVDKRTTKASTEVTLAFELAAKRLENFHRKLSTILSGKGGAGKRLRRQNLQLRDVLSVLCNRRVHCSHQSDSALGERTSVIARKQNGVSEDTPHQTLAKR
jgi:hypothetical protein